MLGRAHGAITVSTLKEAEQFFAARRHRHPLRGGHRAGTSSTTCWRCAARGAELDVLVDSVEARRRWSRGHAPSSRFRGADRDRQRRPSRRRQAGRRRSARHRPRAAPTAARSCAGVLTHAGGSYDCRHAGGAQRHRRAGARAVVRRRRAPARGRPALPGGERRLHARPPLSRTTLDGVTEVRAGVFVFFDLVMAGLGVCASDDIALSVLATVIGHQRRQGLGRSSTPAGWRCRATAAPQTQAVDQGYGAGLRRRRAACIDGCIVTDANQEHGIVARRGGAPSTSRAIAGRHAPAHPAQPRLRHRRAARPLPRRGRRPRGRRRWPRFGGW